MLTDDELFEFMIALETISNPDDGAGRTQELTK